MRVRRGDEQQQNPDGHRQGPDGLQGFVEHLVPDFKKFLMKYRRKISGAKFETLTGGIRVIRYHHFKVLFAPHAHIFMMNPTRNIGSESASPRPKAELSDHFQPRAAKLSTIIDSLVLRLSGNTSTGSKILQEVTISMRKNMKIRHPRFTMHEIQLTCGKWAGLKSRSSPCTEAP
jgi:hypothetical protein